MQQDNSQYPHIGQFHWKYFQQQNGKRNVAVSSTVPRVDMMLDDGMVKEFADNKHGVNYSVLFDREYVFDYFYQKMVVNMGWSNNGRIDIDVLGCFLEDFLAHCEALHKEGEIGNVKAQAMSLAQQFPHKTVKQWERELLGILSNEEDNRQVLLEQQDDEANNTAIKPISDEVKEEWIGISDDEEEMITMDDYDPDVEEDCGENFDIRLKGIRDLKRMASEAKIKGYGSMSKNDLIAAIISSKRT